MRWLVCTCTFYYSREAKSRFLLTSPIICHTCTLRMHDAVVGEMPFERQSLLQVPAYGELVHPI